MAQQTPADPLHKQALLSEVGSLTGRPLDASFKYKKSKQVTYTSVASGRTSKQDSYQCSRLQAKQTKVKTEVPDD